MLILMFMDVEVVGFVVWNILEWFMIIFIGWLVLWFRVKDIGFMKIVVLLLKLLLIFEVVICSWLVFRFSIVV